MPEKKRRMIKRDVPKNAEMEVEREEMKLSFPSDVKAIHIMDGMYNELSGCLDLSVYPELIELIVEDNCFQNVDEVKLIGLTKLERVVIGRNCFTKGSDMNPNRHFYLKECGRLRELRIGCKSFSDYSVCAIENMNDLEVIEMGGLNEESSIFIHASLELKSEFNAVKMMSRPPQTEFCCAWQELIPCLSSCCV